MKKRIISLMLASVMVISTLAACGSGNAGTAPAEEAAVEETEATDESAAQTGSDTPLVVGYRPFSEKFSMFFSESAYDKEVASLTAAMLLDVDRAGAAVMNGIEGETIEYSGTDYTYTGAADLDIQQNDDDTTTYNFKLREDITFSDGEPLTADDLIFSLYVFLDTAYDGYEVLNTLPIVGLKNYRANSTAADSVTADDVTAFIESMPEALATAISENVIAPILTAEKDWCTENFEAQGAASAEEFFIACYSTDETYDAAGKDYDTIVSDVIAMYGNDYQTLGSNYAGDETYFEGDVISLAEQLLIEEKVAAGEGEEVPNIVGIEKLGDYEVAVTLDGFDASAVYKFVEFGISPLHYYGDVSLYDYDNNQFGFPRGDLSIVKEKGTVPMGAGPYKFIKFENKTVYFEANENYYKGAPKIKSVQFKESAEADLIPGVQQGTIDLTDPSGSKQAFEQIGEINGTGELNGDAIMTSRVDNLGYGYIGINSETVNVGGEPDSEQSKDLRKAIATVLSVYRDVTIDSYYGDAASVINYPISNTSWAAPQKSDEGYQVAYSTDVEGNAIYTDSMSADDKYAAALEASLGYFEAAGYTVADGKLTAAPEGARLTYEIIIPADGQGNHPSFAILTDAKAAFETIGFTLEINDPTDSNVLWDKLNAGTQDLWTAAWQATPDPDMYQTYHSESASSNYYHIADPDLDAYIMDARTSADTGYRKSVYKECLNIIMDWAVEIPVYQRQNCIIYSAERINTDSFTPDVTTFYKWWKEIEKLEMK
ncbi:ABC transporter substrate-binding protein [Kineothrix sp. MB12-C1]|uniref:ABC transporter substrate-binding protein n=1 Tax=Kineothrix sp. MB12-C1 TaxID=3070215 RepID=UPI0027D25012|nr:ABC transporter substrate-binding protein [Kineothrix sp. MB12-C1]WMC94270.1 ABC transporter substrate-binding protein [Kineothrix sp. MB12-C1]